VLTGTLELANPVSRQVLGSLAVEEVVAAEILAGRHPVPERLAR
jgi:hypothetical protein